MPTGAVVVKAQYLFIILGSIVLFAVFINLYKAPDVVRMRINNSASDMIATPHQQISIQELSVGVGTSRRELSYLNLAPDLKLSQAFVCSEPILWGRSHGGGWYICKDNQVFTGKDSLSNVPEDHCRVYSFGLGADWSFDNAAEAYGCEVRS